MKFFRITNGFTEMTDAYLLVRAGVISNSIGGNANFPTPSPSLQDVNTTISSFSAAVEAAESGDRQAVAFKNQVRETLIMQLHLLGNYVLFTAANDEVKAQSSGFHISKMPQPSPALTSPQGLELTNGVNKGELKLRFKKVPGAKAYLYEITRSPVTAESKWESMLATVCKNQFAGLESGQEYSCRVAAIGVKKQVAYSDVVARIAL